MRTTLALDDEAIRAIREHAGRKKLSMGQAASELIRRGASFELPVRLRNQIPVLVAPDDFPVITTDQVRQLLDEE